MSEIKQRTSETDPIQVVKRSADQWEAKRPEEPTFFEVGFAREACADDPATVEQQRADLQAIIDEYGIESKDYRLIPGIRVWHNHGARVGVNDFGRTISVDRSTCKYAAYAVVYGEPGKYAVEEGVRLPVVE